MSLFKKKEASFEDMDSRDQLKRIMEQLGFLEKKVDSVLEELRNRGSSRPSFGGGQGPQRSFSGGRDRGGFRGSRDRGASRPSSGGNTRYAGNGPQRYSAGRSFGNEDNRGNFGGNRPDGRVNRHQGSRRPHQHNPNAGNPSASTNANGAAPQAASPEAQPE